MKEVYGKSALQSVARAAKAQEESGGGGGGGGAEAEEERSQEKSASQYAGAGAASAPLSSFFPQFSSCPAYPTLEASKTGDFAACSDPPVGREQKGSSFIQMVRHCEDIFDPSLWKGSSFFATDFFHDEARCTLYMFVF